MATSPSIPTQLLREPEFRAVWLAGGLTGTVRWLEMLSIGVYVFELTASPLWVAALMVARTLPMVLFGSIFGAYADRFNRRHLFLLGLTCVAALAALLAISSYFGQLTLWQVAIGAFLSGTYFSTEFPVRRTLVAEAAGDHRAGTAMALDSATTNATRALGPALGGLVYQSIGLTGAYTVGACAYLISLALIIRTRPTETIAREPTPILRQLAEGLRYVREHRRIRGTLIVTAIINLFGFPFATMVPVIGKDDLGLAPLWVGILASAEGTGAFLGALFIAWFARAKHYGVLYILGSFAFLLAILAFSQCTGLADAWSVLILGGAGIAGFAAMQSAILLTAADPEYRSRVMGILAVCIGTGPIGILHVGLMAQTWGAQNAVTIMAFEGLLALVVTVRFWGGVWGGR